MVFSQIMRQVFAQVVRVLGFSVSLILVLALPEDLAFRRVLGRQPSLTKLRVRIASWKIAIAH